jgi:hypothetical protein
MRSSGSNDERRSRFALPVDHEVATDRNDPGFLGPEQLQPNDILVMQLISGARYRGDDLRHEVEARAHDFLRAKVERRVMTPIQITGDNNNVQAGSNISGSQMSSTKGLHWFPEKLVLPLIVALTTVVTGALLTWWLNTSKPTLPASPPKPPAALKQP